MPSSLFTTGAPAASEGLANLPLAMAKGQAEGMQLARQLALIDTQLRQANQPKMLSQYHGIPIVQDPQGRISFIEPPQNIQKAVRTTNPNEAMLLMQLAQQNPEMAQAYMDMVHPERRALSNLRGQMGLTESQKAESYDALAQQRKAMEEAARKLGEYRAAQTVTEQKRPGLVEAQTGKETALEVLNKAKTLSEIYKPNTITGRAMEKYAKGEKLSPGEQMIVTHELTKGKGASGGLSATERGKIAEEESIIGQLDAISALYKPSYTGPIAGRGLKMRLSTGIGLTPEEAKFSATVNAVTNQFIKELSGAAVSGAEEARMKSQLPTIEDPPVVFKEKIKATKENLQRLVEMRKRTSAGPGSSGKIDAAGRFKQLIDSGATEDQAYQTLKDEGY